MDAVSLVKGYLLVSLVMGLLAGLWLHRVSQQYPEARPRDGADEGKE